MTHVFGRGRPFMSLTIRISPPTFPLLVHYDIRILTPTSPLLVHYTIIYGIHHEPPLCGCIMIYGFYHQPPLLPPFYANTCFPHKVNTIIIINADFHLNLVFLYSYDVAHFHHLVQLLYQVSCFCEVMFLNYPI